MFYMNNRNILKMTPVNYKLLSGITCDIRIIENHMQFFQFNKTNQKKSHNKLIIYKIFCFIITMFMYL